MLLLLLYYIINWPFINADNMNQKKLALSFRGGGARCISYIGFLDPLEENDIEVSMIIGSSAGALIGTAYALGTKF